MWASAPRSISGAGWHGRGDLAGHHDLNQAFRNIVNMLHGVRDGHSSRRQQLAATEQASADPEHAAPKAQLCVHSPIRRTPMTINYQLGDVDAHGAMIRAQAASLEQSIRPSFVIMFGHGG